MVLVCYSLYVDRKLSKIMGRLFSIDGELSNIDGELFGIDNTLPSIDSGLSSIDGMHADAFTEVITTMVIFLNQATLRNAPDFHTSYFCLDVMCHVCKPQHSQPKNPL